MKMHEQHKACELREQPKLYKIGMFANMNRVTIKTLRYYDEQNLIKPVYVDEKNGYRYYEASQIADLHRILALRGMGFSIEDIRRIINGEEEKKEASDKVKFKTLPEVEAACIFHKGSYETFHKSYAVVLNYIEENGYEICGNIRESYIDGVWNKDSTEEWLSEIQIPIRRKG